jgi:predicted DNA-binding transcriptional regulator AlpA
VRRISVANFSSDFEPIRLIGDGEIAKLVSLSKSWVRKQRFNRRHGLPHDFTLDPVMIGSAPRYPLNEVRSWIDALSASRADRRAAQ